MAGGEFDLISRYFRELAPPEPGGPVALGIGDDCALLNCPPGRQLAVSTDTLIAGRHFPENTDPESVGHKALAVNLSDLAAMGAEPSWATLALSLPEGDEAWLAGFARGFGALAREHGLALIGGDTTRGPVLSITVTIAGTVKSGQALCRDGAKPGDGVYVSGELGAAARGLNRWLTGELALGDPALLRLDRPQPRVSLGRALRGVASAAIDISDGLAADLAHICVASAVGAELDTDKLPLAPEVRKADDALALALSGGDDYELCFTVPADREMMLSLALGGDLPACTRIGTVTEGEGLVLLDAEGVRLSLPAAGFNHFSEGG